jgi:cell division protein FtsB
MNTKKLFLNLLALALAGFLLFGGEHNLYQLIKLQYKILDLKQEIDSQEVHTLQLREEIGKLRTDKSYIEKIARERYGMAKSGEKVFILQQR